MDEDRRASDTRPDNTAFERPDEPPERSHVAASRDTADGDADRDEATVPDDGIITLLLVALFVDWQT